MNDSLSAYLTTPEEECVRELLQSLPWPEDKARFIESKATALVREIREAPHKVGDLETFFHSYALDTKEGIALTCLAEALLRIPDGFTASSLVRDKISGTQWLKAALQNDDWMARAAGLGLSLGSSTISSLFSRLGEPVVRQALGQAMKMMGGQFVLGESIRDALRASCRKENQLYRMSYDMLGEGARTAEHAERYWNSYADAIDEVGQAAAGQDRRPGISIKLSALHPRYEVSQTGRCVPELTSSLLELCRKAAAKNLSVTVDAEECHRLDISLKIVLGVFLDPSLQGWEGFGLAVQAYQKRALPLIGHLSDITREHKKMLQVRLVKGAYWDSEIKRAQTAGLADYPVFTRKTNTDLSYLACAEKLLQHPDRFQPMFGTHNAHTVSAILEMTNEKKSRFEFQKLHGMGNALYRIVIDEDLAPVSVYAPVGPYPDLLPYLVRRILENGANSSFVNGIYDKGIAAEDLVRDPVRQAMDNIPKRHPRIPMPEHLYSERKNSAGIDLNDRLSLEKLLRDIKDCFAVQEYQAAPLVAGKARGGAMPAEIINPAVRAQVVGKVYAADQSDINRAFLAARDGFQIWSQTPAAARAAMLDRVAAVYEDNRAELMALIVQEGGRTIPDALSEVREAIEFCRYYAVRGRKDFNPSGQALPGPTGERNSLMLEGRGTFVCISPWNFPLAIFTGQIVAALMAGNAVIAKPAEQTPLTGFRAVQMMIEAGVPREAIALLPGDGRVGAAIVQHPDVAGVAFTGSTEVARSINRALAAKGGPIVPLIAETGGQNAMIVDSSALTEQVVDDALLSAFGSAGQRCSALRVMFVQEDVAEKTIAMLRGAMAELRVGNPMEISSDIGPVIDEEARASLQRHRSALDGFGKLIAQAPLDEDLRNTGTFFAPCAFEIRDIGELKGEVFGPILHVIRYKAADLDRVIASINATGFGLTLGIHSRVDRTVKHIAAQARVGNVYVNRSMIGAVVGVQPFGGQGLSGTGPKAGGPHYLHRFATEKVISTDTTAAGGNASLVTMGE